MQCKLVYAVLLWVAMLATTYCLSSGHYTPDNKRRCLLLGQHRLAAPTVGIFAVLSALHWIRSRSVLLAPVDTSTRAPQGSWAVNTHLQVYKHKQQDPGTVFNPNAMSQVVATTDVPASQHYDVRQDLQALPDIAASRGCLS
jgi:hypothetical protein